MVLSELLSKAPYKRLIGKDDVLIENITHESKKVVKNTLFVCIKGTRFDSHSLIEEVIDKGACAICCERVEDRLLKNKEICDKTTFIVSEDTRVSSAYIAAAFFKNPAKEMITIGITGSKGKTTTAHMLSSILSRAGIKTGTIGTNGAIFDDIYEELANTTPDAFDIQYYMRRMADKGCECVVVESSSQGLKQHRVEGFVFDYGIFTNISEGDHIGPLEHESFEEYLYCKSLLLKNSRKCIVFKDDAHIKDITKRLKSEDVIYYGALTKEQEVSTDTSAFGELNADYSYYDVKKTFEYDNPGVEFKISGKADMKVHVNLPGDFNVINALAASACAFEMGVKEKHIKEALSDLHIRGRFDMVYRGEFSVCVDFAHNGLSTRNHLQALRQYRPNRIICVFGADGNRSKSRRYEMGEASGRLADFSIITSGHNRYETFEEISKDIHKEFDKTNGKGIDIKDRKEAVRYAISIAEKGDIITILGLGHEHYIEENGVKTYYSDIEFVKEVLKEKGLM